MRIQGLGLLASCLLLASGCSKSDGTATVGERRSSTPILQSFDSCDALLQRLQGNLSEEMEARLLSGAAVWGLPGVGGGVFGSTGDPVPAAPQEGLDFSGTNNQESGVDEADFVKTDGRALYILNGNRLEILDVPVFGELLHASTTPIEGRPLEMLTGADSVVVFSDVQAAQLPVDHALLPRILVPDVSGTALHRHSALTKITVLDVEDRTAPTVRHELYLEGWYRTARLQESSVRVVSQASIFVAGLEYWPQLPPEYFEVATDAAREAIWDDAVQATIDRNNEVIAKTTLSDLVPRIYERLSSEALVTHTLESLGCDAFSVPDDGMSRSLTSILSFDFLDLAFDFDADHILTNSATVYSSADTLLVSEPAQEWWWFWPRSVAPRQATNIHRFDISQPGTSTYTGSGRVDGRVLDSFALSEYEGNIRVASTTGSPIFGWWGAPPQRLENHVFVLAGDTELEVVGHVGGIAVGKRLWSSRFVRDRGFLVTFRNVDPLWTLDLSDPKNPEIKGELEVPGVSTYIHPLVDDRLLTIGFEGDDAGLLSNTQVSLFDVRELSEPMLESVLSLSLPDPAAGWVYASSEATYEHKAFQYWEPEQLLAVPVNTYRFVASSRSYEYISLLELIRVDRDRGLRFFGTIDHSDFFNRDPSRYYYRSDVRRAFFLGNFVYAVSDRGVTAHSLADLALTASVPLDG